MNGNAHEFMSKTNYQQIIIMRFENCNYSTIWWMPSLEMLLHIDLVMMQVHHFLHSQCHRNLCYKIENEAAKKMVLDLIGIASFHTFLSYLARFLSSFKVKLILMAPLSLSAYHRSNKHLLWSFESQAKHQTNDKPFVNCSSDTMRMTWWQFVVLPELMKYCLFIRIMSST